MFAFRYRFFTVLALLTAFSGWAESKPADVFLKSLLDVGELEHSFSEVNGKKFDVQGEARLNSLIEFQRLTPGIVLMKDTISKVVILFEKLGDDRIRRIEMRATSADSSFAEGKLTDGGLRFQYLTKAIQYFDQSPVAQKGRKAGGNISGVLAAAAQSAGVELDENASYDASLEMRIDPGKGIVFTSDLVDASGKSLFVLKIGYEPRP